MYYEKNSDRCPFRAERQIGISIGGHCTILHYCKKHAEKVQTTMDEHEVDLYVRLEEMD